MTEYELKDLESILRNKKFSANYWEAGNKRRVYINSIRRVSKTLADNFEEFDTWIEGNYSGFDLKCYIADDSYFFTGDAETEKVRSSITNLIKTALAEEGIKLTVPRKKLLHLNFGDFIFSPWFWIGLFILFVMISS